MKKYTSEIAVAIISSLVVFSGFLVYGISQLSKLAGQLQYRDGYQQCVEDVRSQMKKKKTTSSSKKKGITK